MRPLLILVFCSATALGADVLRFADIDAWSTWDMPYGLVEFGDAGQLQLVKYRKDINAVANAPLFTHGTRSRGEAVAGGIWKAGSNPDAAERTIDGDPATFWQAAPNDALDDWFVQVDLGRAVLAKEIRLTFPRQGRCPPLPPVLRLHRHRHHFRPSQRRLHLPAGLFYHPSQRGHFHRDPPILRPPRYRTGRRPQPRHRAR